MGLIQKVIDDSKALEGEATRAEEDAQKAYEEFATDTNESLDEKNKDMTNKKSAKAKAERTLVRAQEDRESTMSDMDNLDQEKISLHDECDFLMKNFELRQTTRDDE